MPLHEYRCKKCQHTFEKISKFSDAPVKKCPECGGPVEQLLSAPAVQFKGSGWYVTDYARKGGSGKSGASSESGSTASSEKDGGAKDTAAKSGEKSESKKTETKTDTKTESKTKK